MDEEMESKGEPKKGTEKNSSSSSESPEPPDNGPFYCSLCNWFGTLYERFDKPFVSFFIV